jgi:glycosyltransferase involved in cell wall biosynthesis
MKTPITIVVPVGPQPEYKQYLRECIDSVAIQMLPEDQIILIDDKAALSYEHYGKTLKWKENPTKAWKGWPWTIYKNDWLLGCADSWNRGVALAQNDLVLLMGSDDKLLPGALDALREAYEENESKAAWYNLTIQIDEGPDTGIHTVFNNAAAVTKELWNLTGGFPPSGFAAPDALLISIMMVHMSDRLIQVKEGTPLYWCRVHDAQDTQRMAAPLSWEVIQIRNLETARWKKPLWTTHQ